MAAKATFLIEFFHLIFIFFGVFQLYFNDQKPFLMILVVVDDDNTGVDAVFRLCGQIFLNGGVSQSLLSAGIAFNVASAGQSRLRAKIKSVGPTSNPHRLIYIPKKLNETSRQRPFILPLNPFHHRIAQMWEKCTASENHFHLNQHYVKHRILPCRDVLSSFH